MEDGERANRTCAISSDEEMERDGGKGEGCWGKERIATRLVLRRRSAKPICNMPINTAGFCDTHDFSVSAGILKEAEYVKFLHTSVVLRLSVANVLNYLLYVGASLSEMKTEEEGMNGSTNWRRRGEEAILFEIGKHTCSAAEKLSRPSAIKIPAYGGLFPDYETLPNVCPPDSIRLKVLLHFLPSSSFRYFLLPPLEV